MALIPWLRHTPNDRPRISRDTPQGILGAGDLFGSR